MKKITKLTLLGGALALILSFGLVSCSDSDDDSGSSTNNSAVEPDVNKGDSENQVTSTTYSLESNSLEVFAAGAKTDGATSTFGTSDYFTVVWSAKMKVDASSKEWSDGYKGTQRINMAGAWTASKQYIKFKTSKAATVKVWWAAGDANRPLQIAKAFKSAADAEIIATTEGTDNPAKNDAVLSTLSLKDAGEYYLGSSKGGNYIFKIEVTE